MVKKIYVYVLLCLVFVSICSCGIKNQEAYSATIYYVDSEFGDDANSGTVKTPISSLNAVNELDLKPGDQVLFKRGTTYRGQLLPTSGSQEGDIYFGAYGEGENPILMASLGIDLVEWIQVKENIYKMKDEISYDIGNIILDDETSFGVKKWTYEDLQIEGDYFYDEKTGSLYFYCAINPEERFFNIECAITVSIIDQTNVSYVTYDNLTLKYGAAHGIGGRNTSHITIKNLEICYIGGGYLHTKNGRPVRFGNGIEFWANASDNLVENCHIYEIMDSGVTNQNNGKKAIQERISYINNNIHHCGMASFEFDNSPQNGVITDVLFEGNVCEDVGAGFSTTQDRYINDEENYGFGHHITIFYMETPMHQVQIIGNKFTRAYNASDISSMFLLMDLSEEAKEGLVIKNNVYVGETDYFAILFEDGEIEYIDNEKTDKFW